MSTCLAIICLSNLFVSVEAGVQNQPQRPTATTIWVNDRNGGSPLLAGFEIGFYKQHKPWLATALYYRHESMPTVHDKGQDALWYRITLTPFAGSLVMAKKTPPVSTPVQIDRHETWVYIGRRLTTSDTLAFFWAKSDELIGKAGGYAKQIAPAQIGEAWQLTFREKDSYFTNGEFKPKRVEASKNMFSRGELNDWIAKDVAAEQMHRELRADKQLAKRESEFERVLRPLKDIVALAPNMEAREAIIARIGTILRKPYRLW